MSKVGRWYTAVRSPGKKQFKGLQELPQHFVFCREPDFVIPAAEEEKATEFTIKAPFPAGIATADVGRILLNSLLAAKKLPFACKTLSHVSVVHPESKILH